MREILFRGKRCIDGEWMCGSLFAEEGIIVKRIPGTLDKYDWAYVDPKTVGEYTGLTDKNGVKIFEGDVCEDLRGFRFVVTWEESNARFLGRGTGGWKEYIRYVGQEPAVTVIGNIHNPELIKEENK